MYRRFKEGVFIVGSALLFTLLAQSPAVTGALAVLLGGLGPLLVPVALLYHERVRQRTAQLALEAALVREKDDSDRVRQFVQRLLDVIPMPVYVKDAESRFVIVNAAQTREWTRPGEELIGASSISLAPTEAIARNMREEDLAVLAGHSVYKEEANYHPVTGKGRFRLVTKDACLDSNGAQVIVCTQFDTTEWRVAERGLSEALDRETALRERTQAFVQRLIDVIPDPFVIKNAEGRYVLVNDALSRDKQIPKAQLVGVESNPMALDSAAAEDSRREDREVIAGNEIDREQQVDTPASGGERFRHVIKRRCVNVDGSPVIVEAHFDITRWKIAERELGRLALEDSLTGLANRRCFLAEAERIGSLADRHGQALSVLIFDLDYFKRVNDTHGHQAGDDVLCAVAERTRNSLRAEDVPARWGGEEFVVLLPLTAIPQALIAANRLRTAIANAQVSTCAGPLNVTVSCGVAERVPEESILALIGRADAALYRAKSAGRNACMIASIPARPGSPGVATDE